MKQYVQPIVDTQSINSLSQLMNTSTSPTVTSAVGLKSWGNSTSLGNAM